MRRKEKEITNRKELDAILSKARICRIGFVDESIPYIVPMNFGYKNNCLYFHSAPVGKKIDLIRKNTVVCFEVDIDHDIVDTGVVCNWSTKYASVIGYGTPSLIEDSKKKEEALNIIIDHYSKGNSYKFPENKVRDVAIIRIEINEMTGKKSS